MTLNEETRRMGCGRASKLSLGGDRQEDTATPLSLQAAFVADRFAVSPSLARAVAELAFTVRPAR